MIASLKNGGYQLFSSNISFHTILAEGNRPPSGTSFRGAEGTIVFAVFLFHLLRRPPSPITTSPALCSSGSPRFYSISSGLRLHHLYLGHHRIFPLLLDSGHLLCRLFKCLVTSEINMSLSALLNVLFPLNHMCLVSSFSTRGVIAVFMSCSPMTVSTA